MAIYDIIPDTFTSDDIRDTLNANGGSVDNTQPSWFGLRAHLNPWSRKKPLQLKSIFHTDDTWWKGEFGDCGITPMEIPSYRNAIANGDMNGWKYTLPDGVTYPHRVDDFRGYNAKAVPFITDFSGTEVVVTSGTGNAGYFIQNRIATPSNLGIEDIRDFKNYYFGVYASGVGIRATADETIGNGGSVVNLNFSGERQGESKVFPFITDAKLEQNRPDVSGAIFYTVPMASSINLKIVTSFLLPDVNGYVEGDFVKTLKIFPTIYNYSTSPMTVKENFLLFRYAFSQLDDPLLEEEFFSMLPNVTVPANGYYDFSMMTIDATELIRRSGSVQVWMSIDGAKIQKNFFFA